MSDGYRGELCIYKSLTSVSEPLEVIIVLDLTEHSHGISQTVLSEQVDCIEVRAQHAAQPHEVHVTFEQSFHLASGVDVLEICVKNDLQQHAWRKAACAATFICSFDCTDVKMLNNSIKDAYRITGSFSGIKSPIQ